MPLNNIFAFESISIEKQNKIFQKEKHKVKTYSQYSYKARKLQM